MLTPKEQQTLSIALVWGHILSGIVYVAIGTAMLALTLKRVRSIGSTRRFCQVHVPEKNKTVLTTVLPLMMFGGSVFMVLVNAFFLREVVKGKTNTGPAYWTRVHGMINAPEHFSHLILYVLFSSPSPLYYLEARGRLPYDSGRSMLAFAFVLSSMIWGQHASAKEQMASAELHDLVSKLVLTHGLVIAYSVWNPSSFGAYVASQALYVANGLWMFVITLHMTIFPVHAHVAIGLFSLLMVMLILSLVLAGVFYLPPMEQHKSPDVSFVIDLPTFPKDKGNGYNNNKATSMSNAQPEYTKLVAVEEKDEFDAV